MLDIVVDLESVRFCGVPLISQVVVTKSNIPRKQYGHTAEKNSLNPILASLFKTWVFVCNLKGLSRNMMKLTRTTKGTAATHMFSVGLFGSPATQWAAVRIHL